MYLMTVANVAF